MKILLSLSLALFVAAGTQACGKKANPAPEKACHMQQNSYLQRVSWQTTPVTMYADLSMTADDVTALKEAMEQWNDALSDHRKGAPLFKYGGKFNKNVGVNQDGVNVVSITTNWTGKTAEQAQTMVLWENTAIIEADIQVNGEKEYSIKDEGEPDKVDLVALFVHELGHALGLLHIEATEDEPYTVMSPYLARGDVERRTIGPVEINALECEY